MARAGPRLEVNMQSEATHDSVLTTVLSVFGLVFLACTSLLSDAARIPLECATRIVVNLTKD